ncbi:tyrosine-type recombinase/integrase [Sphingopyxis flava]|nr:site-specific integrase [Sphingopyxis flava]
MRELLERAEVTIWRDAKGQAGVRSNVKILSDLVGHEPVSAMTFTRLEKLVEDMRALDYAPATIKRKMAMIGRALKAATEWTDPSGKPILDRLPKMPTIYVRNQKDRILSYAEEEAVFAAIEKRRQEQPTRPWARFAALIRFLLDTGARLGEATGIGPDNVTTVKDDMGSDVRLVTFARYRTKNDKPRSVPLTAAAAAALDSRQDDLGIDPETGQWIYFPFRQNGAWYMWGNIKDDLAELGFNLSDVTLHTMRHTCLTRLAQGGMDLLRLQMWAGHSDPKITVDRYLHLRPAQLLGGLDILQNSNDTNHVMGNITLAGANRAENQPLRH